MTKNLIETVLISNKDYKALLQERDELKKACEKCKLFDIEKTNRDLLEQINKLEQENALLKEELLKKSETEQSFQSLLDENKELKEDLKSQQMINLKQQEIALDYWNALEEIKSICKDENDMCTGECGNFNVAQRALDILRKLEGFEK